MTQIILGSFESLVLLRRALSSSLSILLHFPDLRSKLFCKCRNAIVKEEAREDESRKDGVLIAPSDTTPRRSKSATRNSEPRGR